MAEGRCPAASRTRKNYIRLTFLHGASGAAGADRTPSRGLCPCAGGIVIAPTSRFSALEPGMIHHAPADRGGRLPVAYVVSFALVALALWIDVTMAAEAGPRFVFLAPSLAVAATAWIAGFTPALVAL